MKRTWFYNLIILSAVLSVSACSKNTVAQELETTTLETQVVEETVSQEKNIADYTDNTFDVKNTFTIAENGTFSTIAGVSEFGTIYKDIESLSLKAKNIVIGEVIEIQYTDDDATAKTYYSFAVHDVLKGTSISKESIITVVEFQGYCRLSSLVNKNGADHIENYKEETADSTYYVYTVSGEPLIQVGDKYVLFLDNKTSDGYFMSVGSFMGRYKEDTDGYYSRYSPEEIFYAKQDEKTGEVYYELPMTLDEILNKIQ